MQIAARDRTRIGLQAEVLGANALGVRNILCLSGDSMKMSPEPRGRMDILDIDSIQMLWILRRMRDDGTYLDGRSMKFPPKYFPGRGSLAVCLGTQISGNPRAQESQCRGTVLPDKPGI